MTINSLTNAATARRPDSAPLNRVPNGLSEIASTAAGMPAADTGGAVPDTDVRKAPARLALLAFPAARLMKGQLYATTKPDRPSSVREAMLQGLANVGLQLAANRADLAHGAPRPEPDLEIDAKPQAQSSLYIDAYCRRMRYALECDLHFVPARTIAAYAELAREHWRIIT